MLQGAAADWMTGLLAETARSPSNHGLKAAFEDNYFKAKELWWKDASALWQETQGATERVEDYVTRMRKLSRNLDFSPDILQTWLLLKAFAPPSKSKLYKKV